MAPSLRVGILGVGNRHAVAIVDAARRSCSCSIVGVAGRNLEEVEAFIASSEDDSLRDCSVYGKFSELVADPSVDAIYVGVPTSDHVAWCLSCCVAKKHVLVEKPLGADLSQAVAICDAFSVAGLVIMDASSFVHHSRTRRMVEELREKRNFGPVKRAEACLGFNGEDDVVDPEREPLGCVGDLGWYVAKWGLLAFGPRSTPYAAIATHFLFDGDVPVELTGVVYFGPDRTKPFFFSCSYRHAFCQRLDVFGTFRRLSCDDFLLPCHGRKSPASFLIHTFGGLLDLDNLVLESAQSIQLEAHCQETHMLETFADLVRGDDGDNSDRDIWLQAALQTQAVVSALLESARQGGLLINAYLDPDVLFSNRKNHECTSPTSSKKKRHRTSRPATVRTPSE